MRNEMRKRRRMLAPLFTIGFGLFAAFVLLALNGHTLPALVTGLAGLALLAAFTIVFVDISSRKQKG